jgi:hypothetical protein
MVGAHAGALAFMPLCFLARPRADLLLAIRLDDEELAVAFRDNSAPTTEWHLLQHRLSGPWLCSSVSCSLKRRQHPANGRTSSRTDRSHVQKPSDQEIYLINV